MQARETLRCSQRRRYRRDVAASIVTASDRAWSIAAQGTAAQAGERVREPGRGWHTGAKQGPPGRALFSMLRGGRGSLRSTARESPPRHLGGWQFVTRQRHGRGASSHALGPARRSRSIDLRRKWSPDRPRLCCQWRSSIRSYGGYPLARSRKRAPPAGPARRASARRTSCPAVLRRIAVRDRRAPEGRSQPSPGTGGGGARAQGCEEGTFPCQQRTFPPVHRVLVSRMRPVSWRTSQVSR